MAAGADVADQELVIPGHIDGQFRLSLDDDIEMTSSFTLPIHILPLFDRPPLTGGDNPLTGFSLEFYFHRAGTPAAAPAPK